jgi:hypothetical protein
MVLCLVSGSSTLSFSVSAFLLPLHMRCSREREMQQADTHSRPLFFWVLTFFARSASARRTTTGLDYCTPRWQLNRTCWWCHGLVVPWRLKWYSFPFRRDACQPGRSWYFTSKLPGHITRTWRRLKWTCKEAKKTHPYQWNIVIQNNLLGGWLIMLCPQYVSKKRK